MIMGPEARTGREEAYDAAAYEAQELKDWGVEPDLADQIAALHQGAYGYTEEVDMDEVNQQIAAYEKRRMNQMISPAEAEIVDRIVDDEGEFGEEDIREYIRTVFSGVAHDQMALMRAIQRRLVQDDVFCDKYPRLTAHPIAVRGFFGGYIRDICEEMDIDSSQILELRDKE